MSKNKTLYKEELIEKEIEKMLARENPVEGVYSMYGDHPSKISGDGFSQQKTPIKKR